MGFDSVCDTRFMLGLSLSSLPSMVKLDMMGVTKTMQSFEPSLTLSLSGHHRDPNPKKIRAVANCVSDISRGCPSFSNAYLKRERDFGSEESERVSNDNNYSGVINTSVDDVEDDDDFVNGRKKLRLTKPQSALLEEAFKHHSSLKIKQKQELAGKLKLRPRQVEVSFQNRRARKKLKQTEMDFQHLKELCDKLTYENQQLQKELQELKALKSSQPCYTQLLADKTVTACPVSERIEDTNLHS